MPPEVTVVELKASVGETRLANAIPGVVTDSFLQKRIDAAWAEIYTYVGVWYDLPLDYTNLTIDQEEEVNSLLELYCISIAAHSLFAQSASGVPEGIKISYDRTRSRLKEIGMLTLRLPYLTPTKKKHVSVIGDRSNEITPEIFTIARSFG